MTEERVVHGAATEERIIADAAEFAATASRATVACTNILQAALIAVVVLWVLDVPRQVFNISFYTEQLLTVCLGLTLGARLRCGRSAQADGDRPRRRDHVDLHRRLSRVQLRQERRGVAVGAWRGLALSLGWTAIGNRAFASRGMDWLAAVVSLVLCGYIAVRYEPLTYEIALLPREGIIGSAILIILVLEASRRVSGWGFVGIILAMAVYIYISPHLPGDFQTRYVSPERLVVYNGLDVNGIISAILAVAVLIVIPFTILGQVLARTGGAEFFSDIAMSAMGGFRGGAAKIAVVGSALFGMISGSAVSNVLAVGIVTIPTMIKSGFTRYRAAAIESVGSTGGQLMPPVMGAAAFIMAEFLQVSYGAVCVAAAIPAVALLRLPVHPRRSRSRQAQDRLGRDQGRAGARRGDEIGLAFPGADRCSWCSR